LDACCRILFGTTKIVLNGCAGVVDSLIPRVETLAKSKMNQHSTKNKQTLPLNSIESKDTPTNYKDKIQQLEDDISFYDCWTT